MNKLKLILLLSAAIITCPSLLNAQIITTIAGSGPIDSFTANGDNIPATDARLGTPGGLVIDNAGNIYFTELNHHCVRKISTSGIISTIAGNGTEGFSGDGGPATNAQMNAPFGLAIDHSGNLYVADTRNSCIRKITAAGTITTIAGIDSIWHNTGDGGPATAATFAIPTYLKIDNENNLYIVDGGNSVSPQQIRKIDNSGIITRIAGGGTIERMADGGAAIDASFIKIGGITTDVAGNLYALCDGYLKKISPDGIMTSIAGGGPNGTNLYEPGDGGPALGASINACDGLDRDEQGNFYLCSSFPSKLRKINTAGIINTIAGGGLALGDGGEAVYCMMHPFATAVAPNGDLIVSDYGTNRIRKISYTTEVKSTAPAAENIAVYPTLNNGSFTIDLTALTATEAQIVIMDMSGRKIMALSAATDKATNVTMDAPAGTYYVIATAGEHRYSKQIIIN